MGRHVNNHRVRLGRPGPDALTVALSHHQAGRYAEAEAGYQQLLTAQPKNPDAWHLWGVLAAQQQQYETAVDRIQHALELKPHEPVFLGNLGNAFLQQGQFGRAIDCYREALQRQPENADMRKRLATACERQLDLGIEHQKADRLAEAEACYQDVLRGQPERADAWHLLGTIALEGGEFETAEKHIGRAITLVPDVANFHNSLGGLRQKQQRYAEGIVCYQKALHMQSDMVNAHSNLGQVYQAQHRWADAETSYRQALELRPDSPDAHYNLGRLLKEVGRTTEAEAAYRKALEFKPGYLDAYFSLAELFYGKNRHVEALACFDQVSAVNSEYPFLQGAIRKCRAKLCAWTDHSRALQQLREGVRHGTGCITPFVFLNVSDDPLEQRQCAEIWTKKYFPAKSLDSHLLRHSRSTIRLAYVSPDFGEHPVSFLIADLIERHDRARFEVFGISIGPESNDPWRQRLAKGFDQFLDVHAESDEAVAQRMRDLEIDIAVDLAGYTTSSRPGIFAGRAAPIQVNYLGFPGTMGTEFIDYILADRCVIPEDMQACYTEKVVYLPDTFQCASRREIAEHRPSRRELGLPEAGLVFCCFNNSYKIHPELFDIWMRLLVKVEGSVLWLFKANESVEGNLRREAEARGVSPDRLVFAPRVPPAQYLAQYRQADLFLDTLPYNAGTTASDALWAGLPVLTCAGRSFVSCMAGSLLRAVGVTELVTDNLADYEALALRLATHPDELAVLRQKLERNRRTQPLFDVDRFRRHIEAAYQRMWEAWRRGESPTAFAVDAIEEGGVPVTREGAAPLDRAPEAAQPATQAFTTPVVPKKLLHVGCGPANPQKLPPFFRTPDWQEVRLDINPDCHPDIVASMTSMSPVEHGAFEAIFSSHNLEHLYPHEVPIALKEFQRVLAPDGFVFVTLPDLQRVAELVAQEKLEDTAYESPAGPIAPLDMLYGHRPSLARGHLFMAHRTGFTTKTLANALLRAGFAQVTVRRDGRFGLWAIACRQIQSNEQLAALQRALFASR